MTNKNTRWFLKLNYDADPVSDMQSIRSFIRSQIDHVEIIGSKVICNSIDDAMHLRMSLDDNVMAAGRA